MKDHSKSKKITRRDFIRQSAKMSIALSLPFGPFGWNSSAKAQPHTIGTLEPIPAEEVEQYYEGYTSFFGDIHGHTGFSDGYGLPTEYLTRARDDQELDFVAISDHAEIMSNIEDALPRQDPGTPSLWEKTIDALEAVYAPGQFVTLPGFEWTSRIYGHRNVYFKDAVHLPPSPIGSDIFLSPDDLWQELDRGGYDALTIPHHPARTTDPVDWSFSHERERLVEIYSKWGNSENFSSNYEPFAEFLKSPLKKIFVINQFVTGALLSGHKLGIIAGTDTHQGLAGSAQRNWPRGKSLKLILKAKQDAELLQKLQALGVTLEQYLELLARGFTLDYREPLGANGGLCAVWSTDLTREEIWNAMWDRTTYGTSGIRPLVQFVLRDSHDALNYAMMGGEIDIAGQPELLVNIVADPSSQISRVQLFRRDTALLDEPVMAGQTSFKLTDEDYTQQQSNVFYTLKIEFLQNSDLNFENDRVLVFDGGKYQLAGPQLEERVWVSPIWINPEA